MAEFCQQCSIRVFGEDMGDLSDLVEEGQVLYTLCEGCGWIWADHTGKKIPESQLLEYMEVK